MSEWQPIETVQIRPFDKGKPWAAGSIDVLVCNQYGYVQIARYSYTATGKGRWMNHAGKLRTLPTHWMPLPEPPK